MRTTVNPFQSQISPHLGADRINKTKEWESKGLKEVAQEFEGLLIEQMVREMRKAVPKSPLLGREIGQEIFNEMLDGEFVRLMVERGGIGLSKFFLNSVQGEGK